jgi:hypothetical protein
MKEEECEMERSRQRAIVATGYKPKLGLISVIWHILYRNLKNTLSWTYTRKTLEYWYLRERKRWMETCQL